MKTLRCKYPRTPHLPWSPGATADDIGWKNCAVFEGKQVIVTEKMDGENTSLYRDGLHARSLDSRHHPSRDWVKAWHGAIAYQIPENWRFCGENLYARHSIAYDSLVSYFYLFSVWNEANCCLSWKETADWAALLGCGLPTVLYSGLWDAKSIRSLTVPSTTCEGYVVRVAEGFAYDQFSRSIAKWVRPNHVQTDQHWMHAQITPNALRNG